MLRLVEPQVPAIKHLGMDAGWGLHTGLPRWLLPVTAKLTGFERLRKVYDAIGPSTTPAEFARRALQILNIECAVSDSSSSHIPAVGRTLFVANHPFGALDTLTAIAVLGSVRPDLRVLANTELTLLPELAPIIFGGVRSGELDPTRRNAYALRQAMRWLESGRAVFTFPAVDVAHFDLRARCVTDAPWSAVTSRLVQLTDAQVVPVHFSGKSGRLFQFAGLVAPRLRRLMLPRELHGQRDSRVQMQIGAPISATRLARFRDSEAVAVHLRLKTFLEPARSGSSPRAEIAIAEPAPAATAMPRDALTREIAELEANSLLQQGDLRVYRAEAATIPHVLSDIGRLRELTHRADGLGTGRARDLDRFDKIHEHLIVWHTVRQEIMGACRIGRSDVIRPQHGADGLHSSTAFKFRKPFFPLLGPALEISQLFARGEFQGAGAPLSLLWKGVGELVAREPRYCRLLGTVRLGADYTSESKQLLVGYLRTHCHDHLLSLVVTARHPLARSGSPGMLATELALLSKVDSLGALIEDIEPDGKSVPAALRQYLKLGGRVLGFDVPTDAANSIDCLVTVDLRHSKPNALRRFMGELAVTRFERAHRRRETPEVAD